MRWPWQRRPPEPEPEPPVPDDTPTDPLVVFETFERHGIDYVAIGGIAVQSHGHPRTTRDVDVLVGPEPENLVRLGAALGELRARLLGVDAHLLGIDPTDPEDLREGANFTMMTIAGEVDVWTDAAELRGAAPWPEMRARSIEAQVSGIRIRVCGRDDLIRMKLAADRPKDRLDVAALTEPRGGGAADAMSSPTPEAPATDPDPAQHPDDRPTSLAEPFPLDLRPVADLGASRPHSAPYRRGTDPGAGPGSAPTLGM